MKSTSEKNEMGRQFSIIYMMPVKRLDHDPVRRTGKLPFVPHAGLMLDPGDGNYWRVEQVFYKEGLIECWFDEDDIHSVASLKKWGWKKVT